jgi:transcriptional regulator GlxA family with amidase domain
MTSAGVTAGIDLVLALVAEDLGEHAAKRAAQQLVVYYRRPGGQSQFSALPEADRQAADFPQYWHGPVSGWGSGFLSTDWRTERP